MITKRDKFLLISTFVMGLVTGLFLYVTAYKPNYENTGVSTDDTVAREFSVVGDAYGGFRNQQLSFRILGDRRYTYQTAAGTTALQGRIPNTLFIQLQQAVQDTDLLAAAVLVEREDCRSFVDGIDYTYQVIRDGISYELDTCFTDFDHDTELAVALEAIWEYLANPASYEENGPGSVQEWLQQQLRGQFNPEE